MRTLPLLYAATLFVSAFLLFCIQPLVGKMLLPLLGGTPAVWNTCMVFYQAILLAGYCYAHFLTRLKPRAQVLVHLAVIVVPLFFLPIRVSETLLNSVPGTSDSPVLWLLGALFVLAGTPFFAVSTSAPLLQKWFAQSGHDSSRDPYFLYSASNLGSMLGLLAFPLLLEPWLKLGQQSSIWQLGYVLLVALIVACGFVFFRVNAVSVEPLHEDGEKVTPLRRARWIALAFVPSSLMLGVTTYVSTNVAPLPLLWVIPLALYLLSFILVFAPKPPVSVAAMDHLLYLLAIPVTVSMVANAVLLPWLILPMHFTLFFAAAMVCHGRLALDRPKASHLTEFYLWMSVGGVLGGLFNALIAPIAFRSVIEYPILIVLACAMRPAAPTASNEAKRRDWLFPLALGAGTFAMVFLVQKLGIDPTPLVVLLVLGVPAMLCFAFAKRPVRFAIGLSVLFLARWAYEPPERITLFRDRDFFGTVKVVLDKTNHFHELVHGDTIHGRQSLEPKLRRRALAYFHPSGPIGEVFTMFNASHKAPHIAIIGLGVGAMAAYAKPDQDWWMYEIDPAVERIARDERYFTFLKDSHAKKIDIILGDGRLKLREAPPKYFGLIVLDAFSSDSVPVHLVTHQALELYLSKLADGGIVAFNVSNRFLDFKGMLGSLAASASLNAWFAEDRDLKGPENHGKEQSRWVVMAKSPDDVAALVVDPRWQKLDGSDPSHAFTDDFSNILSVIRWF